MLIMSVESRAPALIPPPMMKWSSVTSDFAVGVVSFVVVEYVVVEFVVVPEFVVELLDVEFVAGVLGLPFVSVEPVALPLPESDDESLEVVVVVVVVPVFEDGFFFTTVDCEKAIPTESRIMQITDNIFFIPLRYIDS